MENNGDKNNGQIMGNNGDRNNGDRLLFMTNSKRNR